MLFIVKPTAACNGACIYCSAYKDDPSKLRKMSMEELRFLYGRLTEYVEATGLKKMSILWHGGEPLLMGPKFFAEAADLSDELKKRTGVAVGHLIQSNITLVSDALVSVLRRLLGDRRLGTSYDPIAGIRLLKGNRSYEAMWHAGLDKLQAGGLNVGVVYVVHALSLNKARDIYQQFKAMDLRGGLRFNPLYSEGLAKRSEHLHISPQQWGEFLLDLREAWDEDGRTIPVAPLDGWEALAEGRKARLSCAFSGTCTRGFTGIEADGTVYSCGRSLDGELKPFGNIHDAPLADILGGDARRAFLNRQEWLLMGECAGCRWWNFCHGGCPNDAYLAFGDMMRKTYWCEGRKLFLDRVYGERAGIAIAPEQTHEEAGYEFDLPDPEVTR
ncbi:MAG: radical SAM protein [Deltaproteobacteria bacterium]|nr:radical SAM protein [Deltaproteobacteria bacterium]